LTEPKLKSLFSELKIHDKEELTFKKLKSDAGDKDGLKEAELRKKLIGIMSTYGLLEHFEDVSDPKKLKVEHPAFNEATDEHLNKMVFKDKKLNKLWLKAERSGFTGKISQE
jgi:alpha-2-macroglobulin receptor-associated protein